MEGVSYFEASFPGPSPLRARWHLQPSAGSMEDQQRKPTLFLVSQPGGAPL